MLEAIVQLAQKAGEGILRHVPGTGARAKTDGSPVTAADLEANALIVEGLARIAPGVPVIAEESELPPYEARKGWKRFFLVDPLDGTKEFISGSKDFTVNIALIEDGVSRLGVICVPSRGLTYFAEEGRGAWRQSMATGERVRIHSSGVRADQPLRLLESRSHRAPALETFLAGLTISERLAVGSSYKFCVLAEGGGDLYARFSPTSEWDVAAGDCIFRNSVAEGAPPSPFRYNQPDLLNSAFAVGAINRRF